MKTGDFGSRFDAVVIGAGVGGLSAALRLAAAGRRVAVVDKAPEVGGKLRAVEVDGRLIDSGPTVLTMRHVFAELFENAGLRFEDFVRIRPLETLARHAWPDGSMLDLHADADQSAAAIEGFAGSKDAAGFRRFLAHAERIYETVRGPFIEAHSGNMLSSLMKGGVQAALGMLRVDWHRTMWKQLGEFFRDPRLRQLFARYATYYGSDPFQAPGTLSVIAHVEQQGVWTVDGGMIELARGLRSAAELRGVEFMLDTVVDRIDVGNGRVTGVHLANGGALRADAVVVNADPGAVASGALGEAVTHAVKSSEGKARSLSAITWSMLARTQGLELAWHNVFFSDDYQDEFNRIFRQGRLPHTPTVYICAQDRDPAAAGVQDLERVFMLVNAPAVGDRHDFSKEVESCLERTLRHLQHCGLRLEASPSQVVTTTPNDFERMFPGRGGALYGPPTHGAMAPLARTNCETKLPNLYLVGGAIHPGAGMPMVALGGRATANRLLVDHPSTQGSRPAVTFGGTSTGSVTTSDTRSR